MKGQNKRYNSVSQKTPFYRKVWFYILVLVIVTGCVFAIWFFIIRPQNSNNNQNAINQSNASSGAVPSSTTVKGSSTSKDGENKTTEEPNPQTPAQYEGDNPNALEEITGFISHSGVSGDRFSIRLTLNQYLNSGTCNLTMTSGSQTVTKSASIFADVSTSTCQGFDVPLSELSSGHWQIIIKVESDQKTGTISGEYDL